MEKITGKNNDIIKGVKKLFASSKERRAQGLFVLEGARLVFDVLNSFYEVETFLITESANERYFEQSVLMQKKSKASYFISDTLSQKLSETKNAQGVFAVCKMKSDNINLQEGKKYIATDNLQDPGNLGTVIRTAEALGIDGVIVGGGCDVYNPKVLRASMGSVLRIDVFECLSLIDILKQAKKLEIKSFATSPDASAKKINEINFPPSCLCVIGNEANGVSDEVMAMCDEKITIPMPGRAESLNAHVAAAITMWEMQR